MILTEMEPMILTMVYFIGVSTQEELTHSMFYGNAMAHQSRSSCCPSNTTSQTLQKTRPTEEAFCFLMANVWMLAVRPLDTSLLRRLVGEILANKLGGTAGRGSSTAHI